MYKLFCDSGKNYFQIFQNYYISTVSKFQIYSEYKKGWSNPKDWDVKQFGILVIKLSITMLDEVFIQINLPMKIKGKTVQGVHYENVKSVVSFILVSTKLGSSFCPTLYNGRKKQQGK